MGENEYNLERARIQLRYAKERLARWGGTLEASVRQNAVDELRERIELLELEVKRWS